MPIIKFRQQYTDKEGNTITIVSTNLCLMTINAVYDYIYCPIKNYVNKNKSNKSNKKTNNREDQDILHILNSIEDINIHNDLLFCLENKDNENEKKNIESIIRKYNRNMNDKINTICYYLIKYLNADNNSDTDILDSNKIYYI